MKLYEYEAKAIFQEFGIPIPSGEMVKTPEEAMAVARRLQKEVIIKAQVLVGGRGKAGGIKPASNPEEARDVAAEILSFTMKGLPVTSLLVEEKLSIEQELYLGITIHREKGQPVLMMSSEGGVDIEEVAKKDPRKIVTSYLDPRFTFYPYQAREIVKGLSLRKDLLQGLSGILLKLYQVFRERDGEICEINPLVLTPQGMIAADAKLIVDDDALYRQPSLPALQEEMPYVELDGTIGCIVNGAGLAMSTMDILKQSGGEPANFLDIGGGASAQVMEEALEKVVLHPKVKAIFINILGGITRCDEIAKGIVQVLEKIKVPVVVRLRGTNEEEGLKILQEKGQQVESSMIKATREVIALAKGRM